MEKKEKEEYNSSDQRKDCYGIGQASHLSLKYWEAYYKKKKGKEIIYDNWLDSYTNIIDATKGIILDLGCGRGNDTLYLLKRGKQVIPCDQSKTAIQEIHDKLPEIQVTKCFNMLEGLPFETQSVSLVIADLSLHYFLEKDIHKILQEIRRVLCIGGYLLFRVNSTKDVNYGAGSGTEIEPHLYRTSDGRYKRFFDENDIQYFFEKFHLENLKETRMDRYHLEKWLYQGCAKR